MQRAAKSASRPGEQRGLQLPSKLPRQGMAPGHNIIWKGLQMGATQMTGILTVLCSRTLCSAKRFRLLAQRLAHAWVNVD